MNRTPVVRAMVRSGVAVLATAALIGAPTVAQAADSLPDLSVSFDRDPVADVDNSGATVGVYVYNNGEAPATAVTLTLDLSTLSDAVVATVPDGNDQCKLADHKVTCAVGGLEPGQTPNIAALNLASRKGAAIGAAGEVTVTIAGAEDDANPADNTTTFPVTVLASGPDLIVAADDLNTAKNPVGPGDQVPFHGAVGNDGDTAATGATFTLNLPTAATVVERYSDCTYVDYFPNDIGGAYVYGPGQITCPLPTLEPNEGLLLFDPVTGDSLFHVTFGRNLPGPEQNSANLVADLAGQAKAAKGAKRVAGHGPSFAAALAKLQQKTQASKSALAKRTSALREVDEPDDDFGTFSYWSKPNKLDVRVSARPVSGKVGQTVSLRYEVVNLGPSDGGGPSVLITAPSGTVLLPADWCWTDGTEHEQRPESKKLRCNFESEYPAVASGYGKLTPTVKLKIKSAPGNDGTIYAESSGIGSTESNKANNTTRIVFTEAGGSGGSGGGLPITGSPVALVAGIGGAVVVLGVVLMVVFRRRRVVVETPRD